MAVAEGKRRDGPGFSALPEECVALVVSFTSPADACRLASVSSIFKSACGSDAVWASFLPPDCRPVVSRSVLSLKEFYFSLCDPVLVDDGKMSFSRDKHSGKKCIMLSVRALSLAWDNNSLRYRSWNRMPDSRFAEVAELIRPYHLKIRGTINSRMLSPGTHYAAYLVFKSTSTSIGFGFQSVEVGTGFAGNEAGKRERSIYLRKENIMRGHRRICPLLLTAPFELDDDNRHGAPLTPAPAEGDGNYFKDRRDGWSEIEFGEFLTKDGEDGDVEMSVLEVEILSCKVGRVVEGIEIRPKYGK